MHLRLLVLATVLATAAFCQITTVTGAFPGAPSDAYQLNYMTHYTELAASGASEFIDITNSGANGVQLASSSPTVTAMATTTIVGSLCINVYVFAPDEQMEACCSCAVTPDGIAELSMTDLLSNTLVGSGTQAGATPQALVVKLVATSSTGAFDSSASSCNAATTYGGFPGSGLTANGLAPGMIAWGTKLHANNGNSGGTTYAVTETQFVPAVLSTQEANKLTLDCTLIQSNGSGAGICKGCQIGALGATKK